MARVALLALLLLVPSGAMAGGAGPIGPVADDREILAFGEACVEIMGNVTCDPFESFSSSPSPDFSAFSDSVAAGDGGFASQTSSVGSGSLGGSGSASGFSDVGYGIGNSSYDLTFTLDSWAELAITGDLSASDSLGFGFSEAVARLSRGGELLYSEAADPFNENVALSYTEVLRPGTYRIFVEADGDVSMDTAWTFTLDATPAAAPVPALGPMALVGLLLALATSGQLAARPRVQNAGV